MNLFFFGSIVDPTNHKISQSNEPIEEATQPLLSDSLDEGDEYVDDALRMTEQTFDQD